MPRRAAPVPAPRFCAQYRATASSVGVIRAEVAAIARECGVAGMQLANIRLAVSEAATNAVIHGSAGRAGASVRVEVTLAAEEMQVVVCDDGDGLRLDAKSAGLGAGMSILAAITGRLDVRTSAAGTCVHMAFPTPSLSSP